MLAPTVRIIRFNPVEISDVLFHVLDYLDLLGMEVELSLYGRDFYLFPFTRHSTRLTAGTPSSRKKPNNTKPNVSSITKKVELSLYGRDFYLFPFGGR